MTHHYNDLLIQKRRRRIVSVNDAQKKQSMIHYIVAIARANYQRYPTNRNKNAFYQMKRKLNNFYKKLINLWD